MANPKPKPTQLPIFGGACCEQLSRTLFITELAENFPTNSLETASPAEPTDSRIDRFLEMVVRIR
jgi:hypothetical protein